VPSKHPSADATQVTGDLGNLSISDTPTKTKTKTQQAPAAQPSQPQQSSDKTRTAQATPSTSGTTATAAGGNFGKQMTAARRKEIEELIQSRMSGAGTVGGVPKEHLNMVVIGHVDAGKSTIMGHMLFLLGQVSQKTMHKYEKDSKTQGKGSFAFAWVLDEHDEERYCVCAVLAFLDSFVIVIIVVVIVIV
jgi:elongation factor 1 alpha-like protein